MAARKSVSGAPEGNREAVEKHIEALRRESQLDTRGEALAQVALTLARLLDGGEPPMMTGTWARELRLTLEALVFEEVPGDSDADSWVDDGVSAPIRNPPAA